ncbi:MAG TPA: hypothetical protein VF628_02730 [Allosphingosinicella sp.]
MGVSVSSFRLCKIAFAAAVIGIALAPTSASAQGEEAAVQAPRRQSQAEALALDAGEYARRHGVALDEAMRRLRAQEGTVSATNRIQQLHAARLAGVSIEHAPDYRIVVLLTGSEPVAEEIVLGGGMRVPILFRTGAVATREQIVAALTRHQTAIRQAFPEAQGMGLDQRTGELVVLMRDRRPTEVLEPLQAELEALTGVPVRVSPVEGAETNFSVEGGSRLVGVDPADGRRYSCTTGFVVTDGARTGIVTAAHCPDSATYIGPSGAAVPLDFVGQWGIGYQDVQVHVSAGREGPYFYADADKSAVRTLTSWRNRTSTRAGDSVCHRGETTGYSCSEVELTDFSPPGDLCAGPCDPVWVTVRGPSCRNGDSGGPVFNGTVAFGITKGGNYASGRCRFYYYMSTDFLPEGWSLLTGRDAAVPAGSARLDRR